jgi:hypothetical protein
MIKSFKQNIIEGNYDSLKDMSKVLSSRRRFWFEVDYER